MQKRKLSNYRDRLRRTEIRRKNQNKKIEVRNPAKVQWVAFMGCSPVQNELGPCIIANKKRWKQKNRK